MSEYSSIVWGVRITRITKLTGFGTWTYSEEDGSVKRTKMDYFIFFVNFALVISSCVYSWINLDFKSSIISIGNQVTVLIVILIAILAMLQSFIFGIENFSIFQTNDASENLVMTMNVTIEFIIHE